MGNSNKHGANLLSAASDGKTDDVRNWIQQGADPCSRMPANPKFGFANCPNYSALRLATSAGHVDTVSALLELGGGALIPTDDYDILRVARNSEIIRVLVHAGASVNAVWSDGKTPLHERTVEGGLDQIKVLVELGAVVDCGNESALMLACKDGELEIFKFLLDSGANIHYENSYSYTAQDFVRQSITLGRNVGSREDEKKAIQAVLDEASVRGVCLDQMATFRGSPLHNFREASEWMEGNPMFGKR
jgi:ankyrin repeat protein|eukprot:TRINITY_DN45053_c0_g1_i1.p1 TRINITY_DN45053_c0_g1~~TRINITY_DN45053_c0_g1_i1.p1  ORF type:complete len:247 (-),score=31.76 TRINITY_DN45053_c0_g1_i1:191-931(-)